MMTSSNGNIFRVTGPLCGEFTGPGDFPTQRPVTRSFDVFFDLRLNKRLCKQSWGWWFETLLCPLWRHSNEETYSVRQWIELSLLIGNDSSKMTLSINSTFGTSNTLCPAPISIQEQCWMQFLASKWWPNDLEGQGQWPPFSIPIESTKTTSMEDVSTGVLE